MKLRAKSTILSNNDFQLFLYVVNALLFGKVTLGCTLFQNGRQFSVLLLPSTYA